ncbi:MAG TPA: NAD-dependent epimerase/dehydratase family protein [Thermoleophilaceae bacterium]|nr:NAD-dependent epimerase/dehydratase family protein [Thermoleophilaceae bacterium]
MKVCVTGATGFVGAHVARALAERGDDLRVAYRNPDRLDALKGVDFRQAKTDVLDFAAMRRAVRGHEVLFHVAGYVGSSPAERVWRLNAHSPVVAVEAAAAEGLKRVVLTSTISAVGPARDGRPADENTDYPENWLGLAYPDSKHEGELAALEAGERHGIEVVVVNPGYVLGVPVNRSQPGETSTRTIGNYLRGRLPGVIASGMNFVDVEDVARGHLLAAEKGKPGERYILGGENLTWPQLIQRVADLSDIRFPVLVLPTEIAWVGRVREAVGIPGPVPAEAYELMGKNWRFSSRKAERELGYTSEPIDESLRATIDWYLELIENDAFGDSRSSGLSQWAGGMQTLARFGLLRPVRLGQRVTGRQVFVGL